MATCVDGKCKCPPGTTGDGNACEDVDECSDTSKCPATMNCYNVPGSFHCWCEQFEKGKGFVMSRAADGAPSCSDVDECGVSGVCGENAICQNVEGSYKCQCEGGFIWNAKQHTCSDEDECTTGRYSCHVKSHCINTYGSYACPCKKGFHGPGTAGELTGCKDRKECVMGACGKHADCLERTLTGGYMCICREGFTAEDPSKGCSDVNECETGNHKCDKKTMMCVNSVSLGNSQPGYHCVCAAGYTGNYLLSDYTCSNVDECQGPNSCALRTARCEDTDGGYTCKCKRGYRGNGLTCKNIDECSPYDNEENNEDMFQPCYPLGTCSDTPGSFHCLCDPGYKLQMPGGHCKDIDECDVYAFPCTRKAKCSNNMGSYSCTCKEGHTGDGVAYCYNMNECAENNPCHTHAICEDWKTLKTFQCSCRQGYAGDGIDICQDIDECLEENHSNLSKLRQCDKETGLCKNLPGSYKCHCQPGYHGSGFRGQCEKDDDDCAYQHGCGANALCREGACVCRNGTDGDPRLECWGE